MNKNIAGAGIAVAALVVITGVILANKPSDTPAVSSSNSSPASSEMGGMDMSQETKQQSGGQQDLTGQAEVTMDIKDFAFVKKDIKISKGTKVVWTNRDSAKHNVYSEDAGGPQSKLLAQGETFEFTFDKAGLFNYLCEPHPYMKAAVNVVE